MAEDYVNRQEFEDLKQKVKDIEQEISSNTELLTQIDKKIDVIFEKIANSKEVYDLKNNNIEEKINNQIAPLQEKVETNSKEIEKIRDDKDKLFWAVIGEFIGLIIIAIKTAIGR